MENIATNIEKLYEKAENYTKTSIDLVKLKAIDKTSEIISSLAVVISIAFIVAIFSLFLNIGIALWIGDELNNTYLGFFIVSGFYFLVGIIIYINRRTFIKVPIDNLIVGKLLEKKDRTNNENNLK
ncbi:hypothetical protein [Flavobacterium sp.]